MLNSKNNLTLLSKIKMMIIKNSNQTGPEINKYLIIIINKKLMKKMIFMVDLINLT